MLAVVDERLAVNLVRWPSLSRGRLGAQVDKIVARADALGALAAGADRLGCRCARPDCVAGTRPASPVVIHVIAEQASLDGRGLACEVSADGLIPPNLIAELATTAQLVPLIILPTPHPNPAIRPPRRWPISCAAAT